MRDTLHIGAMIFPTVVARTELVNGTTCHVCNFSRDCFQAFVIGIDNIITIDIVIADIADAVIVKVGLGGIKVILAIV